MTIKLIAIDIDGTLLNSHHQVTEAVKESLKLAQTKGIKIVLCTGRPYLGVEKLIQELDLANEDDYVINFNGSLVLNCKTKEKISLFGLSHEDYLAIEVEARRLNCPLLTETEEAIYTANRDVSPYTVHEAYLSTMPLKYRTPEEMTSDLSIVKMMLIDEPEKLNRTINHLSRDFYERFTIVKSAPFFLEVLNKEVSKGLALSRLSEHLGLTADEVMAIGDNENDVSMLQYAGLGVAMGNATAAIQKHAQHVTKSNDEDGVAYAIHTYAL
ncbi:sugar-phosphatase [uncultured Enterococcus sp.]|mgnify:FL=1|uniref:sugar-phosphatase n=1 Tax=uncultured Enterococcus sp. TaxID=167972 RepID=UPI002596D3C5|nr:sugar-phosphatase [uncultured Enterococcus sp.]